MICAIIVAAIYSIIKPLTIQCANPSIHESHRYLGGVNMGIWVRLYFFSLAALPLAFLAGLFLPLDWATSLFTRYDFYFAFVSYTMLLVSSGSSLGISQSRSAWHECCERWVSWPRRSQPTSWPDCLPWSPSHFGIGERFKDTPGCGSWFPLIPSDGGQSESVFSGWLAV